jgi:ATP-dependent Clp protease ATP-binding subunit ClpA
MLEHYSEEARQAIFFARLEAIHRGAGAIAPKHIILGLASEDDSRSALAGALKDRIFELSTFLDLPVRPVTSVPYDKQVDLPLDDDAKKALAYGADEADKDRRSYIDTDHLLRGIMRCRNSAATALELAG